MRTLAPLPSTTLSQVMSPTTTTSRRLLLKGTVLDWVIQQRARDLERLGHYGQVTLKSDQETAIVDVLREIANLRESRGTLL